MPTDAISPFELFRAPTIGQAKINSVKMGRFLFFTPPVFNYVYMLREWGKASSRQLTLYTVFGSQVEMSHEDSRSFVEWYHSQGGKLPSEFGLENEMYAAEN